MKKVYSEYKFFGGFGLLLALSSLITFLTYKILTTNAHEDIDHYNDTASIVFTCSITGINLLLILLFTSQCKFIIADAQGIKFINPILPFIRKYYFWSDFDYYVIIDEHSRYQTHEAVWLVKNEKIKKRFSSFYYTNYHTIKAQIKTKSKGKKKLNPFLQFLALLRLKTVG